MKGSVFLTILIAFCAFQDNGGLSVLALSTTTTAPPAPGATTTTAPPAPGPTTTTAPPAPGPTTTTAPPAPGPTTTTAPPAPGATTTTAPPAPGPTTTTAPPAPGATTTTAPPAPGATTTTAPPAPGATTTTAPPAPGPTTTTAPPAPGATTTTAPPAPGATTTTAPPAPGATTTTAPPAPGATTTTAPPAPGATTTTAPPAPGATTTTAPPAPGATTTTAPPAPGPTTTTAPPAPGATTTTAPPVPGPTTTTAPPAPGPTTITAPPAPGATNTTAPPAPGTTNTTAASAPGATNTTAPPASGATSSPTPSSSKTTESSPSTTQEPLPCATQPCNYGATCINLWQERVCQCPYGFFYGVSDCQPGKIFPGQLQLLTMQYKEEMQTTNSLAYKELYNNVTEFFNDTFYSFHYEQTILVSVTQFPSTSTRLRKDESTPVVKFINMFDKSTSLTQNNVTDIIENLQDADKFFTNFTILAQCDVYGCDDDTTNCTEPGKERTFPKCICKSDLAKKNPEDKACLLCDNECTSKNHTQCVHKEGGIPSCTCQPGFEFKNEKCEACSFGYSGKDCSNNVLVIFIGVATACGAVIVVLTGVLIYNILRAKKESSSETRSLLNSDSSSTGRVPEYNSATNFAANEKIFPRVQTRNPTGVNKTVVDNGESQARYTQEPGIANKAYIPERDYDDDDNWVEMSARGKF